MRWFISILVVLALVAGLWWMEQQRQAELRPEPDIDVPAEPATPVPRYPLPQPEAQPVPPTGESAEEDTEPQGEEPTEVTPEPQPPLPDLADSDAIILDTIAGQLGNGFVQQWIKPEFVIPRSVATIHSLDGSAPALKTRPLQSLDTEPHTAEIEDQEALLWTESNAERYDALIDALESTPPERAAALYGRYYSLFQQAWEELGEAEPYFNDRVIGVIDHLLATPDVALPFEVVPHEGRLHFADESLEEQSWGRKLLIRMGPDQAERVRTWLSTFREAATGQAGNSTDP